MWCERSHYGKKKTRKGIKMKKILSICLCAGFLLLPEHSYAVKDPACVDAAWSEFGTCMDGAAKGLIKCDVTAALGCAYLMLIPVAGEIGYLACLTGGLAVCPAAFTYDTAACGIEVYQKLAECPEE